MPTPPAEEPAPPPTDHPRPRRAVFLDRDDTLIRCNEVTPHGDLGDPALVELLPGAADACARLKAAGLALVVVTNQGGVARGRYTEDDVRAVHDRVDQLLSGLIDAFRFCPFHPAGTLPAYTREHPWRKPQPGMVLDAAEELGLDLHRSWMVGDKERDIEAGARAGCGQTILIAPPHTRSAATHVCPNLPTAADLILASITPHST